MFKNNILILLSFILLSAFRLNAIDTCEEMLVTVKSYRPVMKITSYSLFKRAAVDKEKNNLNFHTIDLESAIKNMEDLIKFIKNSKQATDKVHFIFECEKVEKSTLDKLRAIAKAGGKTLEDLQAKK